MKMPAFLTLAFCRKANALLLALLGLIFLVYPMVMVSWDLTDPALRAPGMPRFARRLHRDLTPKYERWALARLQSDRARQLTTADIAGTEWPLFGSAFYLWATEALQEDWEKNPARSGEAPTTYARGAIEAATRLMLDPAQANWVKIHWGDQYLHKQNAFYRMLLIGALTSHARLTGDRQHLPVLRDQVETLAAELDASPHGLLEDYPGECYPGDVVAAISMIRRADTVLGTDHSAFVARALRGFVGPNQDPREQVPYSANADTGRPLEVTRGCGNSYITTFSAPIWPQQAHEWYDRYARDFWQEAWTFAGFREFPKDMTGYDWHADVDAGPVIRGFGVAACAFGVGAARANGRFEHAYPLSAETLVTCWPLPGGTCLLPRMLSSAADAPYLGEAGILFNLTRQPAAGFEVETGGHLPGFVVIVLGLQLGLGTLGLGLAWKSWRRWTRHDLAETASHPTIQIALWAGVLLGSLIAFLCGQAALAVILLLLALVFPRVTSQPAVPPQT